MSHEYDSEQQALLFTLGWWALRILPLLAVLRFLKWFVNPILVYSRQAAHSEMEMYIGGKKLSKSQMAYPFLLREVYSDPGNGAKLPVGKKIAKSQMCGLGLVVPCYNEEARLPTMLKEHMDYIKDLQAKNRLPARVEILLVDDGSKDTTLAFIKRMTEEHPEDAKAKTTCFVRGLRLIKNRGKGAAVKTGTLYSRGEFVLMLDADGATDFHEIEGILNHSKKVAARSEKNHACCIGSRNIATEQVQRTPLRKLLNWGMQKLCLIILGSRVKDTQCGFKIWSREAAQLIFPAQHLERWAFDLEVLFLSYRH